MITWEQIADLPVFAKFYRLAYRLFRIQVVLRTPDGVGSRLIGRGCKSNAFCMAIWRQPGGSPRCTQCDGDNAKLAGRSRRLRRYRCHAGMTEFVIPVIVDGQVVAHLQCGQILDRTPSVRDREALRRRLGWTKCGEGKLTAFWKAYQKSPVIRPAVQKDLMAMLELFANHTAVTHARVLMLEEDPRDRMVSKAMEFLKAHFRQEVGVGEIAAAACTSVRSLARVVQARTGACIREHLHRLRIDHACGQLRETDAKIVDVAMECGYGCVQRFNIVFRKRMGMSPRRWRQQAQQELPRTSRL